MKNLQDPWSFFLGLLQAIGILWLVALLIVGCAVAAEGLWGP